MYVCVRERQISIVVTTHRKIMYQLIKLIIQRTVCAHADIYIISPHCILVAAFSSEYFSDEVERGAQKRAAQNCVEGGIQFFPTARKTYTT